MKANSRSDSGCIDEPKILYQRHAPSYRVTPVKVHVLLPVHNRREITRRFVESLRAQAHSDFELILIDDGSTDETAKMVAQAVPGATIIRGRGDWWWAGSLQQGLDWLRRKNPAPNEVVLFINDDVVFESDFLGVAVEILRDNPDSLLLARIRDTESGELRETGIRANIGHFQFVPAMSPEEINCLSTRGLFARWAVVEQVGNFHPRLLPHYLSDYEWTMRAFRRGFHCITDERLVLESPEREPSGYSDFSNVHGLTEYITRVFSKRSHANPLYWSSFMLLASAWPVIPVRIAKIWARFFIEVFKWSQQPRKLEG